MLVLSSGSVTGCSVNMDDPTMHLHIPTYLLRSMRLRYGIGQRRHATCKYYFEVILIPKMKTHENWNAKAQSRILPSEKSYKTKLEANASAQVAMTLVSVVSAPDVAVV
jgi:hypothetical protein